MVVSPVMRGRLTSIIVLAFGLGATACDGPASDSSTAPAQGGRELDITLPTLEGDDVTLTAATEGDLFVLPFFATWCAPCRSQLAELDEVYRELAPRGLQVYAINVDAPDSQARVPAYVQQANYDFPTLIDWQTEVYGRFNPKGDCPFYVVLDASGQVLMSRAGYTKGDVKGSLRDFLVERLPAASSPTPG